MDKGVREAAMGIGEIIKERFEAIEARLPATEVDESEFVSLYEFPEHPAGPLVVEYRDSVIQHLERRIWALEQRLGGRGDG